MRTRTHTSRMKLAALGGVIAALATAIAVILPAGALSGTPSGFASTATGTLGGAPIADVNSITVPPDSNANNALALSFGALGNGVDVSASAVSTSCTSVGTGLTVFAECTSTITDLVVNVQLGLLNVDVITADLLVAKSRTEAVAPGAPTSSSTGTTVTNLCIVNNGCTSGLVDTLISTSVFAGAITINVDVLDISAVPAALTVTMLEVDIVGGFGFIDLLDIDLGTANSNLTAVIDNTPPVVTILTGPGVGNPGERTTDTTPSYTFSVVDDFDPAPTITCNEDGGAADPCDTPTSHTVNPALGDGARTFEVCATDAGGNSACDLVNFVIDTTGPTVVIDNGPDAGPPPWNEPNDQDFEFSSPSSDIDHFECRLDGGAWTTCTSPKTHNNLGEGEHTFEVRGVDDLGNIGTPASLTFGIDTFSPQSTITAGPGFATNNNSPFWQFAGNDFGGAGIDHFHCWFGSGPVPADIFSVGEAGDTFEDPDTDGCAETGSGDTGRFDPPAAPLSDGQYFFCVQAADASNLNHSHDPTPACATVIVDTVEPNGTVKLERKVGNNWVPYVSGDWSQTIVRAVLTCHDNGSGIANELKKQTLFYTNSVDIFVDFTEPPPEGFNPCQDRAGNTSTDFTPNSADIRVDLGNPVCVPEHASVQLAATGGTGTVDMFFDLSDDMDDEVTFTFKSIKSLDGGGSGSEVETHTDGPTIGHGFVDVSLNKKAGSAFRKWTATYQVEDDSGRKSTCNFVIRVK